MPRFFLFFILGLLVTEAAFARSRSYVMIHPATSELNMPLDNSVLGEEISGEQVLSSEQDLREPIVSRIRFPIDGKPIVDMAGADMADPLTGCPLNNMPPDLERVVTQLVEQVTSSVGKIKEFSDGTCKKLKDQLLTNQANINQMETGVFFGIRASGDQGSINKSIAQAMILSSFVSTAVGFLNYDCISTPDARAAIQKLLGQMITMAGMAAGGWEGMGLTAFGVLVGNLPLFSSHADMAMEVLQRYQSMKEKGSFLCLYRQMQQNNCLLLTKSGTKVISGFDLTYKTGAAATTKQSIEKIKAKAPEVLADMVNLQEIDQSSSTFYFMMKSMAFDKTEVKAFDELLKWCREHPPKSFERTDLHPQPINQALESVRTTCEKLGGYQWEGAIESSPKMNEFLTRVFWNISLLVDYYQRIKTEEKTLFGMVANTWESNLFFENFAKTALEYRDATSGNQFRLDYKTLTDKLGRTLAKASFKELMRKDRHIVNEYTCVGLEPCGSPDVRGRGLRAMLDLCKTFDPTLACLYPENPKHDCFYRLWANTCVGPKSHVCKTVIKRGERDLLLKDKASRMYFDSLCGTGG